MSRAKPGLTVAMEVATIVGTVVGIATLALTYLIFTNDQQPTRPSDDTTVATEPPQASEREPAGNDQPREAEPVEDADWLDRLQASQGTDLAWWELIGLAGVHLGVVNGVFLLVTWPRVRPLLQVFVVAAVGYGGGMVWLLMLWPSLSPVDAILFALSVVIYPPLRFYDRPPFRQPTMQRS